jgi:hypothetical protein
VALSSIRVDGNAVAVALTGASSTITFFGQDGHIRTTAQGTSASYAVTPADTYVRVMVRSPLNTLYFNPILRSDGQPAMPAATIDLPWTIARRAALLGVMVAVLGVTWPRRRRRS